MDAARLFLVVVMAYKENQFRDFGLPRGTRTGNPQRRKGLDYLRSLRARGGLHHQEWGTVMLSIPELDFYVITKRYPDMLSPDMEIANKAMDKFLRSPESAPYRVRDTDKPGVIRQSSIVMPRDLKNG